MARVHHVKKAAADNPVCKKGESYYWWKFRFGGKHYSLTPPKASQLTQSEYLGTVLGIGEQFDDTEGWDKETAIDALESAKSDLDDLKSTTEESLSASEDAFPNGSPTIDLLRERVDALDALISEVEDALSTINDIEDEEEPDEEDEPAEGAAPAAPAEAKPASPKPEPKNNAAEAIAEALGNIGWGDAAI